MMSGPTDFGSTTWKHSNGKKSFGTPVETMSTSANFGDAYEACQAASNKMSSSGGLGTRGLGVRRMSPNSSPSYSQSRSRTTRPSYSHYRSHSYGNTPSSTSDRRSPQRSNLNQYAQNSFYEQGVTSQSRQRPPQQQPPQSPNPNWTSLIPPMPVYPSPSYQKDKAFHSSSSRPITSKGSSSNMFPVSKGHSTSRPSVYEKQMKSNQNTSQISSGNSHNKSLAFQRHSIAYSPNNSSAFLNDQDFTIPGSIPFTNLQHEESQNKESHKESSVSVPSREPTNFLQTPSKPSIPVQEQLHTGDQAVRSKQRQGTKGIDTGGTNEMPLHKSGTRKQKYCKSCGLEITGQFVRALHSAYHVDCFRCDECGKPCSAKFFPFEKVVQNGENIVVPLCEYDYFKKLDLICFSCESALRGPYITALGNKYHLEHFRCAVCQKVFESDESYYENDDKIYCHYHYSKLYASHCEGCHSSIVKQFVELFRGGRNQQWHPECYMVHKFWNVCITVDSVGLQKEYGISVSTLSLRNLKDSNIDSSLLMAIEQKIESTVMNCWLTLSAFEEVTATSISDMLLNASLGDHKGGIRATGQLILYVEVLFGALDYVQEVCQDSFGGAQFEESSSSLDRDQFQPLRKEPRNISGKMMSYLAILRKSNQLASSGSLSAELLSVITGCAHYLKLVIRIGLNNALKVNKLKGTTATSDKFLQLMKIHTPPQKVFSNKGPIETRNNGADMSREVKGSCELDESRLAIAVNATDACSGCSKSIEKACIKFDDRRWHLKCFKCDNCGDVISPSDANLASYKKITSQVLCKKCSTEEVQELRGFESVSNLLQLVYLLKIALSRSKTAMKVSSEQQKILESTGKESLTVEDESNVRQDDYSKTLRDVTRLRTRRQSQKLFNSMNQNARKSVILEAPEADTAKKDMTSGEDKLDDEQGRRPSVSSKRSYNNSNENEHFRVKKSLKIKEEPPVKAITNSHLDKTSDLLQNEKSLTLDDIPRIVAAEQAREQRPNAFKHHNSLYEKQGPMQPVKAASVTKNGSIGPTSKLVSDVQVLDLNSRDTADSVVGYRYYSELSKSEHFILRHIAVEALVHMQHPVYSTEELLPLIQTRKSPNFWDKFKFGSGEGKRDKNSPVFGIDISDLTSRYGVDSDLGVGPAKLKIPMVVDDIINALRQKDMSVEGIFRLNGNIKKLKELTEKINKNPLKSPDFSNQTAVQLAALMKKWLRELPNPLLTYNLYNLWISSQKVADDAKRKTMIQIIYCMLPRSHRNLVEVLLYFFSWVASFAEIDEETGSKMDIHNLATVIAPNILFSRQSNNSDQSPQSGENYFLAIEVVNQLIELHEELSIVPPALLQLYEKCGFSGSKNDNITTKEINSRLEKTLKKHPDFFLGFESPKVDTKRSFNQQVRSNTVERGHSNVHDDYHGESTSIS